MPLKVVKYSVVLSLANICVFCWCSGYPAGIL